MRDFFLDFLRNVVTPIFTILGMGVGYFLVVYHTNQLDAMWPVYVCGGVGLIIGLFVRKLVPRHGSD